MSATTDGQYTLFVCWALNKPDNEEQVREVAAAIDRQRDIPGVMSIDSGPRTKKVDWEGPDDQFDYGMVLTLDSWESVQAYPPHPIHLSLVATVQRLGSNIRGFWLDR